MSDRCGACTHAIVWDADELVWRHRPHPSQPPTNGSVFCFGSLNVATPLTKVAESVPTSADVGLKRIAELRQLLRK